MRNYILHLLAIVLLSACSNVNASNGSLDVESAKDAKGQIAASTQFEPGKGVLIESAMKLTATVLSVDKQDRSIVVKAADGKAKKIELTEDVKNFDQIHPGDEVVVEVYSALAMQLAEPGAEFSDEATGLVAVARPGDKPKMVVADIVHVLAKISEINKDRRELVVTGPLGNSVTLQVPEDVKKFDELKVGDEVNASYFEAFALSVETAN